MKKYRMFGLSKFLTETPEYQPEDRPYMALHGFRYCDILNNATFFTDLELNIAGMADGLTTENAHRLVEYIDKTAESMTAPPNFVGSYQRETKFSHDHSEVVPDFVADPVKRGACWTVAQGHQIYWQPYVIDKQDLEGKFSGRALRTIDSSVALPFLKFEGDLSEPARSKTHYRLAYILMIHDKPENVAALIDALDDLSVFIYLHIDLSASKAFRGRIQSLIKGRDNVRLSSNAFAVSWSHISILWVEIRMFFDLLDMISFDYVINLSG